MSDFQHNMSNLDQMGSSDIEKGKADESVSIHQDRTFEQWKHTFNSELLEAKSSPVPVSCCIFKVPEVLRRQEKEAYEPDVVSIGPFHRGVDKFQLVENVKKWYLNCLFLPLRQRHRQTVLNMDGLIESIKGQVIRARGYYSDPCDHLDQNDFIEMLILDGCFLIELFRKAPSEHAKDRQDEDDPIFNMPCMLEYLYHDLLLLENQLPWFVLESIYNLIEDGSPKAPLSQVVIDFFKDSVAEAKIFSHPNPKSPKLEILHILDLIRTSLVQKDQEHADQKDQEHADQKDQEHADQKETPASTLVNHLPQRIPSAAALSEAGVKFRKGPSGCILKITFEGGIFTIPPLAIDERTGPMFRNLMAYEQCYCRCKHMITSYAVLMDNLIDTNKDVDLLCEKHILANWLSADDASNFFNDLYNDTTVIDYVYKEVCDKVHSYRKVPWHKWRKKLKRDYFETPWSTISFIAAFVLLVLTFLQTIYTLQPYYHPRS